jgi:hypothetical protein
MALGMVNYGVNPRRYEQVVRSLADRCGKKGRMPPSAQDAAMNLVIPRLVTLAAAISTSALVLPTPDADADAQGCTGAGVGIVCINVQGTRTHVDTVYVSRDSKPTGTCGYSATIDVTAPGGGNVYHDDSGVIRNGACSYGRAYIKFNVQRDFPRSSRICARFFEGGKQQGGSPCETIK